MTRAYLTPNRGDGAAECRSISIPIEYLGIVSDALSQLILPEAWEADGDITVNDAIADMTTLLDQWYNGGCMTIGFPNFFWMLWSEIEVIDGNANTLSLNASQILGHWFEQQPAAQNDKCQLVTSLPAGEYQLHMVGHTSSASGITTVKMDGTSLGTPDWYTASGGFNAKRSLNFTVDIGGEKVFTFTMATKNASSSGYKQQVTYLYIIKTG